MMAGCVPPCPTTQGFYMYEFGDQPASFGGSIIMVLILTKSNVDHLTEILAHGQGKWVLYGEFFEF